MGEEEEKEKKARDEWVIIEEKEEDGKLMKGQIIAFNLAVEFLLYSFWHHMMYASKAYAPHVKPLKFNTVNQYPLRTLFVYFHYFIFIF